MKIVIGLPSFNEAKKISEIITSLKKISEYIVVCNDGSTDNTKMKAEESGALVVNHPKNLGYGEAIKSIFL